jgi:nucleotide-binding universal stress UspA family protein
LLATILARVVQVPQSSSSVIESILIAVDAAPFADRVGPWLPDIVGAGVRRATLFHAIEGTGDACAQELDELRPRLDRLAVQLSARDVEADIALKRGDRVKWLVSLAALRTTQLLIVGTRCSKLEAAPTVGSTLRLLLEQSHVPLLVLSGLRPAAQPRLFERPCLLAGRRPDSRVEMRAKALVPATLHPATSVPGECAGASLFVTGPEPAGMTLDQLLAQAACPVLVFPAPSLADHTPGSPNTANPPAEASSATPKTGAAR